MRKEQNKIDHRIITLSKIAKEDKNFRARIRLKVAIYGLNSFNKAFNSSLSLEEFDKLF